MERDASQVCGPPFFPLRCGLTEPAQKGRHERDHHYEGYQDANNRPGVVNAKFSA